MTVPPFNLSVLILGHLLNRSSTEVALLTDLPASGFLAILTTYDTALGLDYDYIWSISIFINYIENSSEDLAVYINFLPSFLFAAPLIKYLEHSTLLLLKSNVETNVL